MPVPYTFATATTAIPLSQLDNNFATAITLGNTAIQLGNTVTTLNNMTLANVTISSGTVSITNVAVTTANVSGTANISTLVVVGNSTMGGNVSVGGNVSISVNTSVSGNASVTGNVSAAGGSFSSVTSSGDVTLSGGTANGVAYLNGSKVLTTGSALTFDGTTLANTGNLVGGGTEAAGAVRIGDVSGGVAIVGARSTTGNLSLALRYSDGGSYVEGARLTSTGLGIGTSSPGSKLDILNTTTAQAQFSYSASIYGRVGRLSSGNYEFSAYENGANLIFGTSTVNGSTTERMRLDSSGNLGIGTATAGTRLVLATDDSATTGQLRFARSADVSYFWEIGRDNNLTGAFIFSNASGGAKTERARIDSSGNFMVGATSSNQKLRVQFDSSSTRNGILVANVNSTGYPGGIYFQGYDWVRSAIWHDRTTGAALTIAVNPDTSDLTITGVAERARWTTDGYFKASNTGNYSGATSSYHEFYQTGTSTCLLVRSTNASYTASVLEINGDRTTTNSTYNLINAYNGAVSGQFIVRDSGNVINTNNSYGAISDVKLKENIVDATPKLDGLMQVRVRNYNLKSSPDHKQIGVIAQELEQVFPSMVEESPDRDADGNDLGTTTKQVKYSVFVPMLIKAMQEQQAQIESLRKRLADAGIA